MSHFTRRRLVPEHMDDPAASPGDIADALRFIRRINRWLHGSRAAVGCLRRWCDSWPADRPIRVLDVGTGSGDIPLAMCRWAEARGRRLHITAIDRHPVTLQCARQYVGDRPDIEFIQADALRLADQFAPGSFDFAHAGMFLHHLQDIEAMTVLRIMDRLAPAGVIWNDLKRGWPGRLGARLLTMGTPRMVRHDALVSVEAGFTRAEAIDLASRAGLQNIQVRTHLGYRFTLTARPRQSVPGIDPEGTGAR